MTGGGTVGNAGWAPDYGVRGGLRRGIGWGVGLPLGLLLALLLLGMLVTAGAVAFDVVNRRRRAP